MHHVGNHGASWSSSAAAEKAYYLRFLSNNVTAINYNSNRAYGFQLRCLQE
ncbi:MAG: hypothetical protein K2K83_04440 [Rikenella sp.]|nr:hypothetical protein [Rikenella sp.]MDE6499935.1 hypothetical protein [Rikenella sp.]